MTAKYKTLLELRSAIDRGEHKDVAMLIDNDLVVCADEHGETLYECDSLRDALHEAYALLGLESHDF